MLDRDGAGYQFERSASNSLARRNVLSMEVTLDTSKACTPCPLNTEASSNVRSSLVTLDVSQLPKSLSNLEFP